MDERAITSGDRAGQAAEDAHAAALALAEEARSRMAEAVEEIESKVAEARAKLHEAVGGTRARVAEARALVAGTVEDLEAKAAKARARMAEAVEGLEAKVAGAVEGFEAKVAETREAACTLGEEIANSITHGLGALLSVAGLTLLVTLAFLRGQAVHVAVASVYGASMALTYLASTLYHAFHTPRAKKFFQTVDHASIYLLIAGSYTPILVLALGDGFGWTMMAVVWTLALAGCVYKMFAAGRHPMFSTASYLFLGWLAVLTIKPLLASVPWECLLLIGASGAFYTVGVAFYVWDRLPYNHAIWHGFVLAGAALHFFAVLFYVIPWPVAAT
jgi:hemolysin III